MMFTYRFVRLFVALSAGGLLAITLMWGLLASNTSADAADTPAGATRYVSPLGSDTSNDCTNSQTPCRTIQHAVTTAQVGDEVRVARGTYSGTMTAPSSTGVYSATVVLTKNLSALLGGYSLDFSTRDPQANETILDASDAPRKFVVFMGEVNTLIDGFTMTGATGACPTDCVVLQYGGGAMWIRGGAPMVSHNRIENNRAYYDGGGIYVSRNASPNITSNVIISNVASFHEDGGGTGGGISVKSASAVISGNMILSNTADTGGGGVWAEWAPVAIFNNTIAYNRAISTTAGRGGGIRTWGDRLVTISHNEIFSNSLPSGGGSGLAIGSLAMLDGNYVHHNRMTGWSGAILVEFSPRITLTNNVISQNDGDGVWGNGVGHLYIINNTVAQNTWKGIEVLYWPTTPTIPFTATIWNNIIVGNGDCGILGYNGVTFVVDYNDLYSNRVSYCGLASAGSHDISTDPQFINAASDYHIRFSSPVVNAGTNTGAPPYDRDGVVRPQGSRIDMGAYEVVIHGVYLPLTLKNH